MGVTVATDCLSEHMAALKGFSYQLVTITLRLIAEVLGLGPLTALWVSHEVLQAASEKLAIYRQPIVWMASEP